MPSLGIIEALDVIEHVGPCLIARAVDFARDPFGLQRGEEALVQPPLGGPDVGEVGRKRARCLSLA